MDATAVPLNTMRTQCALRGGAGDVRERHGVDGGGRHGQRVHLGLVGEQVAHRVVVDLHGMGCKGV